ncbi:hypothetical protein EYF80_060872 [Liparis tanakae]|uniref:Uncharacterized protein n=1 Tax=Liparis tanakae TaxID=230148 RepID=A0A4Z2EK83_9TELE|nr:hypothetical protein EYF80_060872 [Liparis tanakae]
MASWPRRSQDAATTSRCHGVVAAPLTGRSSSRAEQAVHWTTACSQENYMSPQRGAREETTRVRRADQRHSAVHACSGRSGAGLPEGAGLGAVLMGRRERGAGHDADLPSAAARRSSPDPPALNASR